MVFVIGLLTLMLVLVMGMLLGIAVSTEDNRGARDRAYHRGWNDALRHSHTQTLNFVKNLKEELW